MIRDRARRASEFLGPARLQILFWLLALTGLVSLILNAVEGEWVRPAQTALVLAFLAGAVIVVVSALPREERGRVVAIALPALGALALGALVVPQFFAALAGAAIGWVVVGLLVFRSRVRMEYQVAVKHLRRNQYAEAVKVMDGVIKAEPRDPQHYRFRAEVLRVWGKLDRARRDYATMTELDPESAVGYNGLAEVDLQAGRHDSALEAARRAYALAPDEWVAAYNLGMIEDRLGRSGDVVEHLTQALRLKVPDARHRLLIHLYLSRAHAALGDTEAARGAVDALRRERHGLDEWRTLLKSDQAATLRDVLGADVAEAEAILDPGAAGEEAPR